MLPHNEGIICPSHSALYLALLYLPTLQYTTGTGLKSQHEEFILKISINNNLMTCKNTTGCLN